MTKIKLFNDTEEYSKAIKDSKAKFEVAQQMVNYIFEIAPYSEKFNLELALTEPTKYIRTYFVEIYNTSIPDFVARNQAIDLSLYSETKLTALSNKYNEINGVPPVDAKGKLKHIEPKESDFDKFLDESRIKEYELVKQICDSANDLKALQTSYFNLNHIATSFGYRVKVKGDDTYNNYLEPRAEMFVK